VARLRPLAYDPHAGETSVLAPEEPSRPSLAPRTKRALTGGLLAWALLTCVLRLGTAPVHLLNEAREGVYARAMLDSGNFVLPKVPNHVENGEIVPDKPPLFHWLALTINAARALATTGRLPSDRELSRRFDAWSLRAPSALAGVVTVMSVALLGGPLVGERGAFIAAATLLSSWQFVHQSTYGRVDMVLTCCLTLTMLLAGRALLAGEPRALLGAAGAAGLAVLTKGPLGIVLPLLACVPWVAAESVRRRSLRWLGSLPLGRALGLFVLVALPWYAAALVAGGREFVHSQLVFENLHQFTGINSRMGPLYYLEPWLLDSFPWNVLAVAAVWHAWRTGDRRAGFCAVWWTSFLCFFELSAYKRRAYLLPALPAGALLAGLWLDVRWRSAELLTNTGRRPLRPWPLGVAACVCAVIGGAVLAPSPWAAAHLGVALHPLDGAAGVGGAVLALVAAATLIRAGLARNGRLAVAALWTLEAALFIGVLPTAEIVKALRTSPELLVERIVENLPPDQVVTVSGLGDDPTLLILLYFPDPNRVVVIPERASHRTELPAGFYLLSGKEWADIRHAEATEWREIWSDGLREPGGVIPVVLVERRGGPAPQT
jgi:4-amino-4-deoxy-L-arabinose transferase-like glycosyltransferase